MVLGGSSFFESYMLPRHDDHGETVMFSLLLPTPLTHEETYHRLFCGVAGRQPPRDGRGE